MTATTITRNFAFEDEDTCKFSWTFTLESSSQGWNIIDMQVDEREKPRGCSGHPKTIAALLRGRDLGSLHREELVKAGCGRKMSCGQALAQCLDKLSTELI